MRITPLLVIAVLCAACRSKRDPERHEPVPEPRPARDAAAAPRADAAVWPPLAGYPHIVAERVLPLPVRQDVPRFDVGGPVILGGLAVVASSQFGFLAVDWRTGAIAWTRPAGHHVAPPVVAGDSVVLVGDCLTPPEVPEAEVLLGCMRVVSAAGADRAYTAIRARPAAVRAFTAAAGPQALWLEGDRAVRWRRGEAAVSIDLITGIARPARAAAPAVTVTHQARTWDIAQEDGRIIARQHGRIAWQTEHPYTAVLGVVRMPDHAPMLRIANVRGAAGTPQVQLFDMDSTGSLAASFARPTPGISLLGWGVSSIGDAAIAVRMDRSIQRDFVVGYAANAMLMWVFALPEIPRADPVGIAIAPPRADAPGAVVVFHDGDTLTILPELSAPPTSPGAARAPSEIPTP